MSVQVMQLTSLPAHMNIHTLYCSKDVMCRKDTKIVCILFLVDTDVINLDELHVHGT